jgi:hypothetical protein
MTLRNRSLPVWSRLLNALRFSLLTLFDLWASRLWSRPAAVVTSNNSNTSSGVSLELLPLGTLQDALSMWTSLDILAMHFPATFGKPFGTTQRPWV